MCKVHECCVQRMLMCTFSKTRHPYIALGSDAVTFPLAVLHVASDWQYE